MRHLIYILTLASLFLVHSPSRATDTLTILQWNVWQEGTSVRGGFEAIVNEIARLRPDFVTLSEVRNYHHTNFASRITSALRERGETYYSFYSYDSGLLSRYPITDSLTIFPCQNDHGSIYGLRCEAKGRKWAVYTAHLDYLNDTYYEVRGYDGNSWQEMNPVTDSVEVMRRNVLSQRDNAVRAFLSQAEKDAAEGYAVILGGDFNEPSHLDWTPRTRYLYDRHGMALPWTVSTMLAHADFTDAFREAYPDELLYPGFTYPADNPDVQPNRLSWCPLADERERIDYIHYRGEHIRVKIAQILGPSGCIAYGKRKECRTKETFIQPLGTYPSDHKGVFVTFVIK